MKRNHVYCLITSVVLIASAFVIHPLTKKEKVHIKVGFVFIGDEMTPYSDNLIKSQAHLKDIYGDQVECVLKYNVPESKVEEPVRELARERCDFIIAASYGYSTVMKELAKEYPYIQFCVPTGINANEDPVLENFHNCMGTIYQGRYVCGVVAGLKLKEMLEAGIISPEQAKIGYVAAFPYAEVISGYTSFFLGVRSVVPEATMLVKYTNTWSSYALEKKAAMELIDEDCIVISQHSDTTGPAVACQVTKKPVPVYHIGYNQSMTEIAPTRSLVSCTVDYTPYFVQSVGALLKGKKIERSIKARIVGQDAIAGLDRGWIRILDINKAIVPPGTEQHVNKVIEGLIKGKIKVFSGDYTGTNPFDENDRIDLRVPYIENEKNSAPTFHYVLDNVITVLP